MKIMTNLYYHCQKLEVVLGRLKCHIRECNAWLKWVGLKRTRGLWLNRTSMRWESWHHIKAPSRIWLLSPSLEKKETISRNAWPRQKHLAQKLNVLNPHCGFQSFVWMNEKTVLRTMTLQVQQNFDAGLHTIFDQWSQFNEEREKHSKKELLSKQKMTLIKTLWICRQDSNCGNASEFFAFWCLATVDHCKAHIKVHNLPWFWLCHFKRWFVLTHFGNHMIDCTSNFVICCTVLEMPFCCKLFHPMTFCQHS